MFLKFIHPIRTFENGAFFTLLDTILARTTGETQIAETTFLGCMLSLQVHEDFCCPIGFFKLEPSYYYCVITV